MARKKAKELPFLDAREMTLDQWVAAVRSPKRGVEYDVIDYSFPTDDFHDQYLATIPTRDEREVKDLIRSFLVPAGHLGADRGMRDWILQEPNALKRIQEEEFVRRLITLTGAWEGTTWIIDLLPDHPRMAINVVDAYLTAHMMYLPDGRLSGLSDVLAILRARYLERDNPRDSLLELSPRDFELLVAAAFRELGYDVRVTPRSKDGGFDVYIRRELSGHSETTYVECKRYESSVGVVVLRALLGVVTASNATRGILVTTGTATKSAREFASVTGQLEIVEYNGLNLLLNRAFGANWPQRIDRATWWLKKSSSEAPESYIAGERAAALVQM